MRYSAFALAALMTAAACTDLPSPTAPVHGARAVADETCDPLTAFLPCEVPEEYGLPPGIRLAGMTTSYCFNPQSENDIDLDGLATDCEDAMAAAFAPLLRMNSDDRNWNGTMGMVGGEYYYAVLKHTLAGEPRVRILYMPAYYRDEGTVDQAFGDHNGDSEYITIDIAAESGDRWLSRQIFMSAHCGTEFGNACGWYNASVWDGDGAGWYQGVRRGAPVVLVSIDKHANYHSYQQCTWSANGIDYCGGMDVSKRFPVTPGFNLGSYRNSLVDYVQASRPGNRGIGDATESFWSSYSDFRGWQGGTAGSTSNREVLGRNGFLPTGSPDPVDCTSPTLIFCPG